MKKFITVKQLRELMGFTQEYMAYKLNISQSNYCRIEKAGNTHTDNLKTIAKELNVDIKYVIENAIPVFFMCVIESWIVQLISK